MQESLQRKSGYADCHYWELIVDVISKLVTIIVKIFKAPEDFFEHSGDCHLIKDSIFAGGVVLHFGPDDVKQGSGAQEPQDQPELLLVNETSEISHDIFVVARRHGLDLLQKLVHAGVPLFQVDSFYGTILDIIIAISRCR